MTPEILSYLQERGHRSSQVMLRATTNDAYRYRVYEIRQGRSGKKRQIEEPYPELKAIQKDLIPLFERFPLHCACTSRRGLSIVSNTLVHAGARHILRVDISKCYPSTTDHIINQAISDHVIDLTTKSLMMQAVQFFCMFQQHAISRRILPTGAPTSPMLCNIALTPIDHVIQKRADELGYTYTRYMDDIHLSTTNKKRDWSLLPWLQQQVLKSAGYKMNLKKSRWMEPKTNDNIIVTGVRLGLNEGPIVPREFRRMVRAKIQNLAKDGKPLDAETKGCLAYIKSLDESKFHQLLEYYERRRQHAPSY